MPLQVCKAWYILALDGSNWQKVDLFQFQVKEIKSLKILLKGHFNIFVIFLFFLGWHRGRGGRELGQEMRRISEET